MKKNLIIFLSFFVFFRLSSRQSFELSPQTEQRIHYIAGHMTPKELAGQMLMFSYMASGLTHEIVRWVRDESLGNIKIFGWNAVNLEQLSRSTRVLQKLASEGRWKIPLIIATDQEGGIVRHVKGETSFSSGNMSLGASGIPYDAYQTGYYIAKEMKALGINMNFAPTIDLYLNHRIKVVGVRAFSEDPVQTGILGMAFFEGQEQAGLISTAKHFPGHGAAEGDSHGNIATIKADRKTLMNRELVPYRMLIREGVPAVMVGHLRLPMIDKSLKPASLSSLFLREILRKELGFKGVIITDDLVMYGVTATTGSITEAAVEAFKAGNDIMLVSRPIGVQHLVQKAVIRELQNDPALLKQARESVVRILRMKFRYIQPFKELLKKEESEKSFKKEVPYPGAAAFFLNQAVRSITVVKGFRIVPKEKKILIAGAYRRFRETGKEFYPHAEEMPVPYFFSRKSGLSYARRILKKAGDFDAVVIAVNDERDLFLLKHLNPLKEKLYLMITHEPLLLFENPEHWVRNILMVYSSNKEAFIGGFGVLSGTVRPEGKLPITLRAKNSPTN